MRQEGQSRQPFNRSENLSGKVEYFQGRALDAQAIQAADKSPEGIAYWAKVESIKTVLKEAQSKALAAVA